VGYFPTNFQHFLAAKLLIGSKKLEGCKNGTHLLYHYAKYGGDCGSRAGCRPKSVMFFVFFLFVTLSNDMTKRVITETLLSTVIVKTIIVSLHRERFVVVHLCSSFPIDPQNFFSRDKFLPKITIFGDFLDRKATLLKLQWSNLAWKCSSGTPSPDKILYKSNKGIYPFGGKFIPKINHLWRFLGRKSTF